MKIFLQTPLISDLEKRCLQFFGKHQHFLIDRRRQDVRDQAKEMAEAASMYFYTLKFYINLYLS